MEHSWTEIIQALAALVAVPGALTAFFILFKRDKTREMEITSLATIASQLTQMQLETEKRYQASKKPLINFDLFHFADTKEIRIDFVNTNHNSTLTSFSHENGLKVFSAMETTINEQDSKQSFSITLSYKSERPVFFVIKMNYVTVEGYIFVQDIAIWPQGDQYDFSPSAIINKNNLPSKSNKPHQIFEN